MKINDLPEIMSFLHGFKKDEELTEEQKIGKRFLEIAREYKNKTEKNNL